MFKALFRTLCFVLFSVFLISCSSNSAKKETAQEVVYPKKYSLVSLGKVVVELDDKDPDEKRIKDKKTFEDKIPGILNEKFKEAGFTVVSDGAAKREGLIVVNLKVRYDPGNRALRWLAGPFGAGKGKIDASIDGVESTTGAVVASQSKSESKRLGGAGGNFYSMAEDVVGDLADDLAEDLAEIKLKS